jgi:hypothetical protein
MDRYELQKNTSEENLESKLIPELKLKQKNPYVEPMNVQFRFNTNNAMWSIRIKRENDEDWEIVFHIINNHTEILYFSSVEEAQQWCEKKGLL